MDFLFVFFSLEVVVSSRKVGKMSGSVEQSKDSSGSSAGAFKKINAATSGAREEKELPVGKHSIQLYSLATPNGQKLGIMLEELGIDYDAWFIDIFKGEQFTSGFVAVNPNSKIPAMVDYDGPGGKPINLFESGSMLLYLAKKYKKFIPDDAAAEVETMNWLFFQMGTAPYFGQFGHFYKYAPEKIEYCIQRYATETCRIFDVVDKHLEGRTFLAGEEFTIADIALFPWMHTAFGYYDAEALLNLASYENVNAWKERILARPAVQKGLLINGQGEYKNYHSGE